MNHRNPNNPLFKDRETVVYDDIDDCPYIRGNQMCTPMRYQHRRLTAEEVDQSLALSDRRVGYMLYRPSCPNCNACEAIRIPVRDFQMSKSMRRILRKNKDIKVEIGPAICDEQRIRLYNRHKFERNLASSERRMTVASYEGWLINTCVETKEFRYFLNDELIGVSLVDFGARDVSSVYFYFNPDHSNRSLGTFSALVEMQWMKHREMRYYYLGLYVESCQHLNYKSRYYPHERRVLGEWKRFENASITRTEAPVAK
ncbi:MAG: arginyltransferase [Myxococcota bacterium]